MRGDKRHRHQKFVRLINEALADANRSRTVTVDGFDWACLPQSEWSHLLGVTAKTVRELAKSPPIITTRRRIQGKVVALYRTGTTPHVSYKAEAGKMAKLFKARYGKNVSKHEYGCLCGLAQTWPTGLQAAIFKAVLDTWPLFRQAVKFEDAASEHYEKYYEFVPVGLVRKYPDVAVEIYVTVLQEKGGPYPDELVKICPAIAPKLAGVVVGKHQAM